MIRRHNITRLALISLAIVGLLLGALYPAVRKARIAAIRSSDK